MKATFLLVIVLLISTLLFVTFRSEFLSNSTQTHDLPITKSAVSKKTFSPDETVIIDIKFQPRTSTAKKQKILNKVGANDTIGGLDFRILALDSSPNTIKSDMVWLNNQPEVKDSRLVREAGQNLWITVDLETTMSLEELDQFLSKRPSLSWRDETEKVYYAFVKYNQSSEIVEKLLAEPEIVMARFAAANTTPVFPLGN